MIVQLSRNSTFTKIFGIPEYSERLEEDFYENPSRQKNQLYKTMRDCELILRYFALRDAENIRGSMKSMLDRSMKKKISKDESRELQTNFAERIDFLNTLFDGRPFQILAGASRALKISAALYDAAMVATDQLWEQRFTILNNKELVQDRLAQAIEDPETYEVIVGRANTAEAVKSRIRLLESILKSGT